MKYSVGVDIGSSAIRVAAIRGLDSEGFAAVDRIGIVPLREGIVQGGHIRNHLIASQALIRALEMAGVPRYGFVVGLGAPEVAVSRVALPSAIAANERVSALRTLDRQISPTLSLEESVLATNEVRTDITGDGRSMTTLVVTAARREEVESLQKLMLLAGCQPRAIDLSAAGLVRALVRVPSNATEVHTVVDIGETTTTVATRQGAHLRSVRVIPTGGRTITRAVMSETEESLEQATARRQLLQLSPELAQLPTELSAAYGATSILTTSAAPTTLLDEAVEQACNDLIDAIATAIENDAANFGNTLTQGVVLSGLTSQIPGLRNRVNQRLGVPVQLGRPWARLEKTRHNLPYLRPDAAVANPLPELSTAIGLAMWKDER